MGVNEAGKQLNGMIGNRQFDGELYHPQRLLKIHFDSDVVSLSNKSSLRRMCGCVCVCVRAPNTQQAYQFSVRAAGFTEGDDATISFQTERE